MVDFTAAMAYVCFLIVVALFFFKLWSVLRVASVYGQPVSWLSFVLFGVFFTATFITNLLNITVLVHYVLFMIVNFLAGLYVIMHIAEQFIFFKDVLSGGRVRAAGVK